jgi:ABC-type antimicrobial peptide transport system permease subunit
VGDVRHNGLDARPTPHIYLSHNQEPWSSVSLMVRAMPATAAPVAALRAAVRALDPELPLVTRTMDEVVARSVGRPRFYLVLVGVFASLALALALVGIFGVVSFVAAQRRREIGVRIALGARPGEVVSLVIAQGMRPILTGIAAGVVGALVLTRFMQTLLYGVVPTDPLTFGATIAAMSILGIGACWLPARRAAHLDPLVALRAD